MFTLVPGKVSKLKSKFLRLGLALAWATGLGPLLSSQDLPSLVLGDPIFGEEDWQLGFSVDLDFQGDTLAVGTPDYRYVNDGKRPGHMMRGKISGNLDFVKTSG